MNQEQQGPSVVGTLEALQISFNIILRGYAALIHAFIRHRFGAKYFGLWEIIGMFVPIFFVMTVACFAPIPMSVVPSLGTIYIFLMIWHRMQGVSLSKKSIRHSQYNGYPWLCHVLPFSEDIVKRRVEPVALVLAGFGVVVFDPCLGIFLMVGGFAIRLDHDELERRQELMIERIHDAEIDQDLLADELERRQRRNRYGT